MTEKYLEYTFDEIDIGLTKEFQITITESMVNNFANISGDFSPIHIDEEYAKSTIFQKRIVHGMLLAFLSRMQGMYLPGKHALYISQSSNFINPCFIDEKITVEGEVLDKSLATKFIKLKTTITNESGKTIIDGNAVVIVRDD